MNFFEPVFLHTMELEGWGKLTNNPLDPGKMTFCGISRRYWPDWIGWKAIDVGNYELALALVRRFYIDNFWKPIKGDHLAQLSPDLAAEVFDTAVNVNKRRAARFLQRGFNVASATNKPLVDDGKIGPVTLYALKQYLHGRSSGYWINLEILINALNGEQYIFYKNNPRIKTFRGWLRRLSRANIEKVA